MSVNVRRELVEPGSDEFAEAAWALKERIRETEGVLRQRRSFFMSAYRRGRVHLYLADDDVIGFATVRRDGYILFLAVAPEVRGEGYGERLVSAVAEEHETVTCHARTSNQNAVAFYKHLGFTVERRVDNYYEDGGDAYYLQLGEKEGLAATLARLVRG